MNISRTRPLITVKSLLTLTLTLIPYATSQQQPQVQLDYITVQGTTIGNNNIFKGIPYASPPIGSDRWMPPNPPKTVTTGVYDASGFKSSCLQGGGASDVAKRLDPVGVPGRSGDMNVVPQQQSEDCLFINVWTPNIPPTPPTPPPPAPSSTTNPPDNNTTLSKRQTLPPAPGALPVIVWVHPGAYVSGSGDQYTSTNLMSSIIGGNAVLVNFNYRLGVFGFLSNKALLGGGRGGNFGLLDQEAAFLWVRKYIAAFGGDPTNVTAIGTGSGAR
ncbi:hypothetical protein HDU76_009800 [Blyttiomyces sp. JEL0837]|nr:hypothetical protein HDU76_009800 [Blyttiomyces sp. JEL0837]